MTDLNAQFRWSHADNHLVWDEAGKEYIDFTSGIFAASTGHSNYRIAFAIAAEMGVFGMMGMGSRECPGLHTYTYGLELRDCYIERLLEWTGYEACHLFTTGSEAVEAALRVMGIDDGEWISAIPDAFHGKTYGPRSALKRLGSPLTFNNWIVEGYRGWDAHFWEDEFIEHWKVCQQMDHLICFDEIQSGFGRTGRKFAYEHYKGIRPDIVVIGKGAFSGFPGSAILSSDRLLAPWIESEELSSTHGGGPLACAAGLATLEEFERLDLVNEARRKGEVLHDLLGEISAMGRFKKMGRGMVAALLTPDIGTADSIVLRCRERGLLVVHTAKASVKIGPPLTIPDEALLRGLEILKGVLE